MASPFIVRIEFLKNGFWALSPLGQVVTWLDESKNRSTLQNYAVANIENTGSSLQIQLTLKTQSSGTYQGTGAISEIVDHGW